MTELKPGDQITVECVFNSINRTTTTNYGAATTDEMCMGFLIYYPSPTVGKFRSCGQWSSFGYCDSGFLPTPSCDATASYLIGVAMSYSCNLNCSQTCLDLIVAFHDTGCFEGDFVLSFQANYPWLSAIVIHCNATIKAPIKGTGGNCNAQSFAAPPNGVSVLATFVYIALQMYIICLTLLF